MLCLCIGNNLKISDMPDFVHLHNHTHYSIADAINTCNELIDAAVKDGQRAIAITDHGVMFGAIEFYRYAKSKGIKPIIGMEAYMAHGSRFDKISGKMKDSRHKNYYHLLLLAKDLKGYKNLIKLTSLAHTEGYYYKPRIDRELLEKYSEGLIATSACIGGVINWHLITGEDDEAYKTAKYYKDLFGEDFYIELQNHNLNEDTIILKKAPEIAKKLGIKLVATNDIHYCHESQAIPHNVFLNIKDANPNTAGKIDIYNLRYRTPQMFFKTKEEMISLFKDFPEAIDCTNEIADKCNLEIENKLTMPDFKIPKTSKAKNIEEYLKEQTIKGLEKKFGKNYDELPYEVRERAEYELDVINRMNFPSYFLIVQDFVRAAKEQNVSVGPGRGSAAGSLVSYALDITNINPLEYNLLFERFLNPDRYSLPDIDIDFSDTGREKVLNYVKEKYGEKSVAMICSFVKMSSKLVLKDVGRVLGVSLAVLNDITKKVPVIRGKNMELEEALKLPELRWIEESKDESIQSLIEYSRQLENRIKAVGTHAAGVVIAPGDITDYVPVYYSANTQKQTVKIATQYSKDDLEYAGLLKMDFLGIRTLSIIDNTIDMVKRNYKVSIDIDKIDFFDKETYEMLARGETLGVFQFESPGMQQYLKQLKPSNLEDLSAMNALYRPGPMDHIPEYIDRKFGRKPIKYLHPIMEKSLKTTYGIIVYQEQVMQLVRDLAGFSLAQADILRRAMGKKNKEVMNKMKPVFIEGIKQNGIDESLGEEIFELIQKFADYGFNKSHSLAYSYLAFQTAWLKCHYTAEFLAANMTAEINNLKKVVSFIEEAQKFGIEVLPPDINRSLAMFTVVDNKIYFGLAGIKNVGVTAVEKIVEARNQRPFESIFDFASRVDTRLINKRAMEALICAGAFDSIHPNQRARLFESIDLVLDFAKFKKENKENSSVSLFGENEKITLVEPTLRDIPEWSQQEKLAKEKDVLEYYVSGHPLNEFLPIINSFQTLKLGDHYSQLIGNSVRVCGIITNINEKLDKKQQTFAFVRLEDFTGFAECILWSDVYSNNIEKIYEGAVVMFIGKSELDQEKLKITVNEVLTIDEMIKSFSDGYKLIIKLNSDTARLLESFKKFLCNDLHAQTKVLFHLIDKEKVISYIAEDVNISLNQNKLEELVELFGLKNVLFLTK